MARALIALVTLGWTAAAGPAAPLPKGGPPPTFFPAQVGAKWVWTTEGGRGDPIETTDLVTKVERAAGETKVTVGRVGKDGDVTWTAVTRESTKGLFRQSSGGLELDPPLPLLRFPVTAGDTWETPAVAATGEGKGRVTVVGVEEVEVPAGKFKAVRVQVEKNPKGAPTQTSTQWWAEGVGLVKSLPPGGRVMVLKSFSPGK